MTTERKKRSLSETSVTNRKSKQKRETKQKCESSAPVVKKKNIIESDEESSPIYYKKNQLVDDSDIDSANENFEVGSENKESDAGSEVDIEDYDSLEEEGGEEESQYIEEENQQEDDENVDMAALGSEQDENEVNLLTDSINYEGENLDAVKKRIARSVLLLQDWKKNKDKVQLTRPEVIKNLENDVVLYYGYSNELAAYFITLLGFRNAIKFFEASESQRPVTLRTNSLLTSRTVLINSLTSRGCQVEPYDDWTKVGLLVKESTVPVGATPEYCAGHYMIQSTSSFLPVLALAPEQGELILDMAAAPGGKSTYISQLMKNTGVLFCNDINKERLPSLVANIHRMAVTNTVVLNLDGLELPQKLPLLDRVLIDAPCTGLGVISRDVSVKVKRTLEDIRKQGELQKKLLLTAIDLVNPNSKSRIIVYSTCSLSIEENEEVVNYAIKNRHIKILPIEVDVGEPGIVAFQGKIFHPSIKHARRIYPHIHDMDGFFYCKIQKLSSKVPQRQKKDRSKHNPYVKNWGKEHWDNTHLNSTLSEKKLNKTIQKNLKQTK